MVLIQIVSNSPPPLFKILALLKIDFLLNYLFLLYYKSKWANFNFSYMATIVQHTCIFQVMMWHSSFSRFISIMDSLRGKKSHSNLLRNMSWNHLWFVHFQNFVWLTILHPRKWNHFYYSSKQPEHVNKMYITMYAFPVSYGCFDVYWD